MAGAHGIAVFLAHEYLGTLLQEAAKDHYPIIKAALSRLVRRTTGANREIRVRVITPTPVKVDAAEPVILSVWAKLRDGRSVSFIFEHNLPDDSISVAVESALHLLTMHYAAFPDDELSAAPAALPSSSWAPVVMRFHRAGHWRHWTLRERLADEVNSERDEAG